MKTIYYIFTSLIMCISIALVGCSKVETSESLKAKYGLTPLGVEECDSYLNKLRICVDKAPSKERESIVRIYTFIISDMKNLAADESPKAQEMVIKACEIGESTNGPRMKAIGCEW